MRILVSNDDGYFAPGIAALAAALSDLAEVTVVAPERDRSGASNSLTLDRPRLLRRASSGFYYERNTYRLRSPCGYRNVRFAADMVVSGINHGANMGDDTIYSGTVAAATEGFLLGVPSIAFSLAGRDAADFSTAAQVARELVMRFMDRSLGEPVLLNVNIPDVSADRLREVRTTRLWRRHKAEPVIRALPRETKPYTGSGPPDLRRTPERGPTFTQSPMASYR